MGRVYSKLEYMYAMCHALYNTEGEITFCAALDDVDTIDDSYKIRAVLYHIREALDIRCPLNAKYGQKYYKQSAELKDLLIMVNLKLLNLPNKSLIELFRTNKGYFSRLKTRALNRYSSDPDFKNQIATIIKSLS